MGITFAATVMPQISVTLEAFTSARAACYPAFAVINRQVGQEEAKEEAVEELAIRRGGSKLPEYKINSSSDAGVKLTSVTGEIEFRNVTFHYPTRQETNVFRDFSLKIEAGKTVALVGFSGSVCNHWFGLFTISSVSDCFLLFCNRASRPWYSLLNVSMIRLMAKSHSMVYRSRILTWNGYGSKSD